MRVAVIGAGAAGLTAARALCDVGMVPVVYEQSTDVGGLWVYREDSPGPAYRSLRTNTSRDVTAFSDAPFPDGVPDFPSWRAVADYLRGYAAASGVSSLVRFGHRVIRVESEGTGWRVQVAVAGTVSDTVFDAVLVCTGIFRQPVVPAIPGLDGFTGMALHSIEYRLPERFAGRDVLVVGMGSSAVDIAVDLLPTASSVTLSCRRGSWVAPRMLDGRPLDHQGTRLSGLVPVPIRTRRRRTMLLGEYARRGIDSPQVLWARNRVPFDPDTAPSVTSDDVLPEIMRGRIRVRPGIERVEGEVVMFADGSRLSPDVIIFGTGYSLDFTFLPASLQPWADTSAGLYRLVFPPAHPTLGFIGVCRVHGPIPPIVEMQSRWAARVLAGPVQLPSLSAMRNEIKERKRRQSRNADSLIRVSLLPYLDEIGELIGVRPRAWRHPRLVRALMSGPPVAAQYRLDGPDRWNGAAEVIASASRQ